MTSDAKERRLTAAMKVIGNLQRLVVDAAYLVEHGQSEAASRMMREAQHDGWEKVGWPAVLEAERDARLTANEDTDEFGRKVAAARSLKEALFRSDRSVRPPGFIGAGTEDLHVYLHCQENEWRGDTPQVWQHYGVIWPVVWHYGVGRSVA